MAGYHSIGGSRLVSACWSSYSSDLDVMQQWCITISSLTLVSTDWRSLCRVWSRHLGHRPSLLGILRGVPGIRICGRRKVTGWDWDECKFPSRSWHCFFPLAYWLYLFMQEQNGQFYAAPIVTRRYSHVRGSEWIDWRQEHWGKTTCSTIDFWSTTASGRWL